MTDKIRLLTRMAISRGVESDKGCRAGDSREAIRGKGSLYILRFAKWKDGPFNAGEIPTTKDFGRHYLTRLCYELSTKQKALVRVSLGVYRLTGCV
jgi:hypothetical protein